VLGAEIERRRLPDFDYGGFVPEKQFKQGNQEHRRGNGQRKPRHTSG
jgi:hypothetical protein